MERVVVRLLTVGSPTYPQTRLSLLKVCCIGSWCDACVQMPCLRKKACCHLLHVRCACVCACSLSCLQAYFEGSYDIPSATLQVIDDQATTPATPDASIRMALELSGTTTSASLVVFDAKTGPLGEASGAVQTQMPGEFVAEFFSNIAANIFGDVPTDLISFISEFYFIAGPAPMLAFLLATVDDVRVCG